MSDSLVPSVKKSAVAGLIVIAPLILIAIFLQWIFAFLMNIFGDSFVNFTGYVLMDQLLSITMYLIISGFAIIVLGKVFRTYLGRRIETKIDRLFDKLPVLGRVYGVAKRTSKDILDEEKRLQEPVKVDNEGLRRTAFRTGNQTDDGREILFMPTAPNITSGFVIEMEKDDIMETNETVDEAIERLLSAGFAK